MDEGVLLEEILCILEPNISTIVKGVLESGSARVSPDSMTVGLGTCVSDERSEH